MLPTNVVIPQATTVLAIGPATVLAVLAVAMFLAVLVLGTAAELRDRDAMSRMDPVLPLHPPLAPPDREAHQEAA